LPHQKGNENFVKNHPKPSLSQRHSGLDALVSEPTWEPLPKRWRPYLSKVILDPFGRPYQYRNPGVRNPEGFDVFSLGADGADGVESADDVGNWED
jgi:general secretion pathway protein G